MNLNVYWESAKQMGFLYLIYVAIYHVFTIGKWLMRIPA